jgi:hypothetical protein
MGIFPVFISTPAKLQQPILTTLMDLKQKNLGASFAHPFVALVG